MKAREENGVIKFYPEIPGDWKNYLNFRQAPESVWQEEGFYDVVEPVFDPVVQRLGSPYFDILFKVFTYPILDKVMPSLDEAKALKLNELKNGVKELYASVQWLVEAYRMEETPLPAAIRDKIKLIKTRYEQARTQINALITAKEIMQWQVPVEQINKLKNELEQLG